MATMQPQRSMTDVLHCFSIAVILMTSLSQGTMGCFPIDDVFKTSCLWTQSRTIDSHLQIDVCGHHGDAGPGSRMTFTPSESGTDNQPWHWDCEKATSTSNEREPSYMVNISGPDGDSGYRCVRFFPLTPRVVSLEWTDIFPEKDQLHCSDALYSLEESVLVASLDLDPVTCPLVGGYQILMHLPDDIPRDRKCLDQAATYKPHLQFGCDGASSSRVLADLGPQCMPGALQESRTMRGRSLAHLDCVDSWQENTDRGQQLTTVLLRMQDSNSTFWCLHVRRVPNPNLSGVSFAEETLYSSFLTFGGRCVSGLNGQSASPEPSTMFGHLAAFRPGNDSKCREPSYLSGCESEDTAKCQQSTDCPKSCGRCLGQLSPVSCSFPAKLQGSWESFSYQADYPVLISGDSLKTSKQGEFKCQSPYQKDDKDQELISLVQTGQHSTCMPYYSCASLTALAPGILKFRMFPARRNGVTGEVESCSATSLGDRLNFQPGKTDVTTLVQPDRLEETSCNLMTTRQLTMVNTGSNCRLTIHECADSCHTFNMSLEAERCDNQTAEELGLLTRHTCLALLPAQDRWVALTRSPDTEQYLCWVGLSTSVFLLSPELCSVEQIDAVMDDPRNVPNPLEMLKAVWPQQQKDPRDRSDAVASTASVAILPLVLITVALPRL